MSELERRVNFSIVDQSDDALPTLATPPSTPAWNVKVPVATTGVFAVAALGSMFLMPLNGIMAVPIFMCVVVILSACWFFASLTMALVWREWQHGNAIRAWERKAIADLGTPYDRWRVYARENGDQVEISRVRYVPQHQLGQTPLYRAELVEAHTFDPDDEITALETLSEWQADAHEREDHAHDAYTSRQGTLQSAGDLAQRLQAQLPRHAADG